jgi:nitrite reductase (NADH) small subunit
MSGQWKLICKLKDVPLDGARLVHAVLDSDPQQGEHLSDRAALGAPICCTRHRWNIEQEVAGGAEHGLAPQPGCARRYSVKIEDGKVYLDLDELSAPASRAEAALAGSFGVATRVMAFG